MAKEVFEVRQSNHAIQNAMGGRRRRNLDTPPPHLETYNDEGNGVFVSSGVSKTEKEENTRMARDLAKFTKRKVYVLPTIDPSKPGAEQERQEYFPRGYKENKNPDFFMRGRFVDGKTMENEFNGNRIKAHRDIQLRMRDAFKQGNDIYIEIPRSYPLGVVRGAIIGKINSSAHPHIAYVNHGGRFFVIGNV